MKLEDLAARAWQSYPTADLYLRAAKLASEAAELLDDAMMEEFPEAYGRRNDSNPDVVSEWVDVGVVWLSIGYHLGLADRIEELIEQRLRENAKRE